MENSEVAGSSDPPGEGGGKDLGAVVIRTKKDAAGFVKQVKAKFGETSHIYHEFTSVMSSFQFNRISLRDVSDSFSALFSGYPDLIDGVNSFLPRDYHVPHQSYCQVVVEDVPDDQVVVQASSSSSRDDSKAPLAVPPKTQSPVAEAGKVQVPDSSEGYNRAICFVNKIKIRLKHAPEKYSEFIEVLHEYHTWKSQGNPTPGDESTELMVYEKVSKLFQGEPDLMQEFIQFMPNFLRPTTTLQPTKPKGMKPINHSPVPRKASSSRPLEICRKTKRDEVRVQSQPGSLLVDELSLELSKLMRFGPSYCLLPRNTQPTRCSSRDWLEKQVLNDEYRSYPLFPDDNLSDHGRPRAKKVDLVEDQRFELDILIDLNRDTIIHFERILGEMGLMTESELSQFKLDECLGGRSPTLHKLAVRRLYGSAADTIIEGLMKCPNGAIPIVLPRLKAKDKEWRDAKAKFVNNIWKDNNAK